MTGDTNLHFHPAAAVFPMMENPEFQNLVSNIREHGLIDPITLHPDGSILDGRNRYRACIEAGVEPEFITWNGTVGAEIMFIISRNIHRRHLSREQRRDLIAALLAKSPERSNRQIAGDVKADHKTVAAERTHLEQRGEIPHVTTRTDTKGRSQPATKKPVTEEVNDSTTVITSPISVGEEVVTPDRVSVEQRVRRGLQMEDTGERTDAVARSIGMSAGTYRKARYIIWIADREDLSSTEHKLSTETLLGINQGMGIAAQYKKVLPIIERIWGDAKTRRGTDPARVERRRKETFDRVMGMLTQICSLTPDFKMPSLDQEQVLVIINDLKTAEKNVRTLRVSIEEMYNDATSAESSTPEGMD